MRRLLTAVTVVTIFMLSGCGDGAWKWFPVTDPNAPASVVVTAAAPLAGSSLITATVKKPDSSAVADGTVVNFSSNGGTLSATSATTAGGIATTTLSSVDPGSFTVTATAGNASGQALAAFLAIITITAPAATTPNTPTSIEATVAKPDGITPVVDGTPVNFTALPAGATFTPATIGTSGGIATVSFSATTNTYTITATVGAATKTAQVVVQ